MATPSVEALLDAAIAHLLTLSATELHATAVKKRVPFYVDDDINSPMLTKAVFPDAKALRKALVARDPSAKRSALFLLTSADAASAWPILSPFVGKKAPAKSKGYDVVTKMAPYLVGTIPNIPDDELLPLFTNPKVEPNALVAGVVFHRKSPQERLDVLGRALGEKQNDGTWRLANALVEALERKSRTELAVVLRAAKHASWKAWCTETLVRIGEPAALHEAASGLDSDEPEKAIGATIALGPASFHELESRFFGKKALRTKAGRETAAAILHGVTTAVLLHGKKEWKKAPAFVASVDALADADGEILGRTAASLARVLRGKKPLF